MRSVVEQGAALEDAVAPAAAEIDRSAALSEGKLTHTLNKSKWCLEGVELVNKNGIG